jgi:hypothetical protein
MHGRNDVSLSRRRVQEPAQRCVETTRAGMDSSVQVTATSFVKGHGATSETPGAVSDDNAPLAGESEHFGV